MLATDPPRGLHLLRRVDRGDEMLSISVSLAAVVSGVVATREGRPAGDSRLGNLASILAVCLWFTLLAMFAGGR